MYYVSQSETDSVHFLKSNDNWMHISPGLNAFYYLLTPVIMDLNPGIYNPIFTPFIFQIRHKSYYMHTDKWGPNPSVRTKMCIASVA